MDSIVDINYKRQQREKSRAGIGAGLATGIAGRPSRPLSGGVAPMGFAPSLVASNVRSNLPTATVPEAPRVSGGMTRFVPRGVIPETPVVAPVVPVVPEPGDADAWMARQTQGVSRGGVAPVQPAPAIDLASGGIAPAAAAPAARRLTNPMPTRLPPPPAADAAAGVAPPVGGVAPVGVMPKYGSMDYVRRDGSRRVVADNTETNLVPVQMPDGSVSMERVDSSTPMKQTPNFETNVREVTPAVNPLVATPGAPVRMNRSTGAEVQMPAEAWARYDAAQKARGGGVAPVAPMAGSVAQSAQSPQRMAGGVAPVAADRPGGTNAYARAVGMFAASRQRPGTVAEGGGRRPELQAQRDLEMDRHRRGLRSGATSVNLREFDQEQETGRRTAVATANAERNAGLVRGQQDVDREGNRLNAQAEVVKAMGEAEGRLQQLTIETELKQKELDLKYPKGSGVQQYSNDDLMKMVPSADAAAIRAARAAKQKTYDPDPERNEREKEKELTRLARQFYGKRADAETLRRYEDGFGAYVDEMDRRQGGGVGRVAPAAAGGAGGGADDDDAFLARARRKS